MPQHLTDLSVDRVDLVDNPASPGANIMLFKRDENQSVLDFIASEVGKNWDKFDAERGTKGRQGGKGTRENDAQRTRTEEASKNSQREASKNPPDYLKNGSKVEPKDWDNEDKVGVKPTITGNRFNEATGQHEVQLSHPDWGAYSKAYGKDGPDFSEFPKAEQASGKYWFPASEIQASEDVKSTKKRFVDDIFKDLLGQYPEMTSPPVNEGDAAGHVHAIFDALPAEAKMFDDVVAEDAADDYACDLLEAIDEATCALRESVCSILEDDEVTDKQKMLAETFDQYHQHLQDVAGAEVTKALGRAKAVSEGEADMTEDDIKKAIGAEVAKVLAPKDEEIKKLQAEIAELKKAKMTPEEEAKLKAAEDKKKEDDVEKKLELPEEVKKQLAEIDTIKKQNATYEEERQVVAFGKRATAIGLVEAEGEILRKAYTGDAEAIKKLEEKIKGLNEQVAKGSMFKEFGNKGSNTGTGAMATLISKRDALMATDPKLSKEQAFAKVYADPANAETVALEKRERLAAA